MKNKQLVPALYALAAAVFYALNVPLSKLLLGDVTPTLMAAFLYLGAGAGVGIMYLLRRKKIAPAERLEKADFPYTAGMVVLDIAAPIFLMLGISIGSAANASLLGNFEIVATTLIALLLFREKVSGKLWTAIVLIVISSAILSFEGSGSFDFSLGSVFVLLAAACWGLENNCTRKISDKSTYQIVTVKGLCSGAGSLAVAAVLGDKLPSAGLIICTAVLGFVSYGLSIFMYIRAQRGLGAAKTSAYYAAAPFVGTFLAFVINGERLTPAFFAALIIMIAGTVLVAADTFAQEN